MSKHQHCKIVTYVVVEMNDSMVWYQHTYMYISAAILCVKSHKQGDQFISLFKEINCLSKVFLNKIIVSCAVGQVVQFSDTTCLHR